jgi:hypothetical protein
MDPRKRQTATATPAEPGGLFDFASHSQFQRGSLFNDDTALRKDQLMIFAELRRRK